MKERGSLQETACGRSQSSLLRMRAPSPALLPVNAGQALGENPGHLLCLLGLGGSQKRGRGNINKGRMGNLHFLAQSIFEGLETGTGGGARTQGEGMTLNDKINTSLSIYVTE